MCLTLVTVNYVSQRNNITMMSCCSFDRRQTEEEVGRQHQGMDGPGVRQVPEGIGEQGKMEKTGCKSICGAQTTLAVKGLMMMMMMMSDIYSDVNILTLVGRHRTVYWHQKCPRGLICTWWGC